MRLLMRRLWCLEWKLRRMNSSGRASLIHGLLRRIICRKRLICWEIRIRIMKITIRKCVIILRRKFISSLRQKILFIVKLIILINSRNWENNIGIRLLRSLIWIDWEGLQMMILWWLSWRLKLQRRIIS
jgi:hypothetical protein